MAPILLPLNADMTAFHTFFSIRGKEFAFDVLCVPPPKDTGKVSLANAKLHCNFEIRTLLTGLEAVVQQRLNQSMDVPTFVMELKDILESAICVQPEVPLPPATFYAHVLSEISVLGWEHLAWLGTDINMLHFRIFDVAGREHIVEVALPPGYPKMEPRVSADLPCLVDLEWHEEANLKHLLQKYSEAIQRYQEFWLVMEDVDKKVWVMEPEHPSRADSFRRIALGGHCSLSITVDPLAPCSLPEFRFFGSDITIAPLRNKMNNNMKHWRLDKLLLQNLEDVLEVVFPSPKDTSHEDISADCGICYTFRLPDGDTPINKHGKEGSIPDRACDNGNCGRPFHTTCLVEWLHSIATTRQSFDVLFGNCPYCSHPIAVKLTLT